VADIEMTNSVLQAVDVTVKRSDRLILDEISISISADAKLLVQGPSGAGKTTLFNVLGLLDVPTSGSVVVGGTDTGSLSERKRARLRRETIGMVFQDFQLVPDLTARENAALSQEHMGERDDAWLDMLFEKLEIDDLENQYPATLSGGEKQRVAIARALANQPDVILADEPTGQLDPKTADRVLQLLLALHPETETALVVISHDQALMPEFDSVVSLRNGRIAAEGVCD